MDTTVTAEYTLRTTYLDTAAHGLIPARAVAALHDAEAAMADGRFDLAACLETVETARAAYARIAGVPATRVAVGSAVSVHAALIASSLPQGAEVLCPEQEFSSLVTPFAQRGGLRLREVPLEKLADAVCPDTALVAVSATQSLDGRVPDLAALREAARHHGARLLVDTTQSVGWQQLAAEEYDFTVCAAFKWLLCPRGASFLTVPADGGGLRPLHAGPTAGEDLAESCYGPVSRLAGDARRFDEGASYLSYLAAARSLQLVEELGVPAIRAHNLALAERFRAGLTELGLTPVPGASPIVSVPGLGHLAQRLRDADVHVAPRGRGLRASFHIYNTIAHVDRALEVLGSARHHL